MVRSDIKKILSAQLHRHGETCTLLHPMPCFDTAWVFKTFNLIFLQWWIEVLRADELGGVRTED